MKNLAGEADCTAQLAHWRDLLIQEARRLGDPTIIDESTSTGLAEVPFDRGEIDNLPISDMGWNWY